MKFKTIEEISIKRITKECCGSWKWQQPYRVTTYKIALLKSGKIVWQSYSSSHKYSLPQIKSMRLNYKFGSLHNIGVSREWLKKRIGISRIKAIENRGYWFEK